MKYCRDQLEQKLTQLCKYFARTEINHIDTNSKHNKHSKGFVDIILLLFIFISIISLIYNMRYSYQTFPFNGLLPSLLKCKQTAYSLFLIFFVLVQCVYLFIGLTDCFSIHFIYKDGCYRTYTYLYARAHNIFFLTICYIILMLFIFLLFINTKNICIDNLFSFIGTIITFSALSLAGRVSTANSIIIVLSISLLMQFGLLFYVVK